MSNTTHSRAPWSFHCVGNTGSDGNRDNDIFEVRTAKGHILAEGLRKNDARLIAAAPKLLDLLAAELDLLDRVAKGESMTNAAGLVAIVIRTVLERLGAL